MANDYNASLVINTADAQAGVRSLDGSLSTLDKTLAALDKTMKANQGNLDAVVGKMSELTRANATLIRSETDRAKATAAAARADREQIVNQGKIADAVNKTAESKARQARTEGQTANAGASSQASNTRRDLLAQERIAQSSQLGSARLATEQVRGQIATEGLTTALIRQGTAGSQAEGAALRLANAHERTNNSTLALNDSLSNSRYLLYDVGQTYSVLSTALLAIPVASAAVAIAYEKDFAQVMRTNADLGNSGIQGFAPLRQELKDLATQIPLTFGELSKISTIGGQLNISGKEIGAFTETVARFGAASNVGLEEASTAFGRFDQTFNSGETKIPDFFNKVGSAIAFVGVKSAATETEIIAVSNQISAAGKQFGFTAEQVVGLSGALASVRIRPELARGAFQRIMLGLSRAADEGSASFDKFAKYTGVAGQAAIDLFKTDPSAFFYQYIGGIKTAIKETGSVSGVLDDIGAKNVFDKQFILGLSSGYNVFGDALKNANSAFNDGTFLNKSTQDIFDTLDARIKRISSSMQNLGDTMAKGTLGKGGGLSKMADGFLNVANAADRFMKSTGWFKDVLGLVLGLGSAVGILLAFKAAQAFVLAGLVGFQQVLGKTSIAAGLTLRGNMQELAKTFLMTKGVTAEMASGFVQANGVMRSFGAGATMTKAQVAAMNAGLGASAVAAATSATSIRGIGGSLKAFGSTALGLIGGPIGAIVSALGVMGFAFVDAGEQANAAGDEIARALTNGAEAGVAGAASALGKIKVKMVDAIALGNLDKSFTEVAKNAGVPFEKLAAAAAKGRDAGKEVLAVMDEIARSKGFKNFEEMKPSGGNHVGELEYLRKTVEAAGNDSAKTAENLKAVAAVTEKVGGAAAGAIDPVTGLATGIDGVGDGADDASKSLDTFLAKVFGIADAQAGTQAALSTLGEGLAKSTDFGAGSDGGRDNVSNFQGAIKAAILEQQQLIDQTHKSTAQASADYVAYVNGLVREMTSRGVDPAAVQVLANQAKGYFSAQLATGAQPTMPVTVDGAQATAAVPSVASAVQANLDTVPAKVRVDADTTGLDVGLTNAANVVGTLVAPTYGLDVQADTSSAVENVNNVQDFTGEVVARQYEAQVGADTSPAIQNLQNLADFAQSVMAAISYGIGMVTGGMEKAQAGADIGSVQRGSYASAPVSRIAPVEAPAQVRAAPKAQAKAQSSATPDFSGLDNGYNKVADAAKGAGDAGKQAGKDMADGIGDATKAADDYAQRLKTGLTSAFDKQYGMVSAADAYHSALNAINKKREDELKQIDDLIAKQKELNNSRKGDLVNARKAGIEKNISVKYGEVDRAADYANQEQTALDAAAAKQKDIIANNGQVISLKAGIGAITGYSDAAIANREALRGLESKMLDMVSAYAATGASQEKVRAYAVRLTGQFKADVAQLGYNRVALSNLQGNLSRYISVVNAVPHTKATTVTANTGGANNAINGVKNNLAGIPAYKRIDVEYRVHGGVEAIPGYKLNNQQVYRVRQPDGSIGVNRIFNKGGQVEGFAGGGQIPGKAPSNPGIDNLMAQVDGKGMVKVRSGEFITQQPAVDYWGLDFMNAINNMKMPQFNSGGAVGAHGGGSGASGPVLVELTAENITAIMRAADRPINLMTEDRVIAQSASRGSTILASTGSN